jgi:hypothetical protein
MKFFDPILELLKFRQAYACLRMVDIAGKYTTITQNDSEVRSNENAAHA